MVKCAWLIFIRSSSKRLPGKAYMKLGDNIMLEHIVANLKYDGVSESDIYLCTSSNPTDDRLQRIAIKLGIKIIRGVEREPTQRYWMNSEIWNGYRYISRVNGDSPMYLGRLGIEALEWIESQQVYPDIITNIRGGKRHFPSGLSLEMYSTEHLNKLLSDYKEYCSREHMSDLIQLSESQGGRILGLIPSVPILEVYNCKLSVDTIDDYNYMSELLETERYQEFIRYYRNIPLKLEWVNSD